MRFLHLSDLHLGKQMNDLSLLPDQEAILQQILSIAKDEQVHAVLIAGDVYQRSTPQAEAMALFDRFVSALVRMGKKVFVISGNHDSALRISYFASLIKTAGVYVTEQFDGHLQKVTLQDGDGDVDVWMLPFLRPAQVKRFLPEEKITTYQDAVSAVIRQADIQPGRRNVLLAHQFITGSETSDSEEHMVGGLDQIDASVFDGFDYVALGHIHGRQRLSEQVRYAGAPLHYSFGEGDKPRGSWLVELDAEGLATVTWLELPVPRRLTTLVGPLDELLSDERFAEHEGDWVSVEYTDTLPQRDPMRRLQERFSHCACVAHRPANAAADDGRSYAQRVRSARSDRELLDAFLRHVREGDGASDRETALIDEMLDDRTLAEAAT